MESNKQGVLDPGQTTCANLSWPAQTRKWSNDSSSRRKFMAGLPRICDIERQKWCCNSDLLLNIRVLAGNRVQCPKVTGSEFIDRSRMRGVSKTEFYACWSFLKRVPLFFTRIFFFFFLKIILKKQNKSSMIIFFILFRDLKIFDSIRFDDFFFGSILRN